MGPDLGNNTGSPSTALGNEAVRVWTDKGVDGHGYLDGPADSGLTCKR